MYIPQINYSARNTMSEPATSAAGGVLAWKLIASAGLAGALATVIVMIMTRPRSTAEWAASLIATLLSSICGGAAVIYRLGLQPWADDPFGVAALIGLSFACGLPGWIALRAGFSWWERRRDMDLGELATELADDVRSVTKGSGDR